MAAIHLVAVYDLAQLTTARLVSPAYSAPADQAAQLRQQAGEARAAVERCEREHRYFGEESEGRWHAVGFVRQVMHRSGAHTDPFIEELRCEERIDHLGVLNRS